MAPLQLWFSGGRSVARGLGYGFLAGSCPTNGDRQSAVLDWRSERLRNIRLAPLLGIIVRAARKITASCPDLQICAVDFDMYLAPPRGFGGLRIIAQHVVS